eukprot:2792857-Amphidinium_carterae.1
MPVLNCYKRVATPCVLLLLKHQNGVHAYHMLAQEDITKNAVWEHTRKNYMPGRCATTAKACRKGSGVAHGKPHLPS